MDHQPWMRRGRSNRRCEKCRAEMSLCPLGEGVFRWDCWECIQREVRGGEGK